MRFKNCLLSLQIWATLARSGSGGIIFSQYCYHSADRQRFFHCQSYTTYKNCVVPSRTAVSKFPKIGYVVLFLIAIISRYESGLSLVRNLVAISELLYNHWSPCLDFSSNSIATRVSMRRVVASRSEDNAFVISSADCGEDAERSLSKIPNSHAAKSAFDKKTPLLPYEASLAWEKELENFLFRSFCPFFQKILELLSRTLCVMHCEQFLDSCTIKFQFSDHVTSFLRYNNAIISLKYSSQKLTRRTPRPLSHKFL